MTSLPVNALRKISNFGNVHRFERSFVDKLKQGVPVISRFERIAYLLAILCFASHFGLADVCFRYVDVRTSFQIVELHVCLPNQIEGGLSPSGRNQFGI